MGGASNAADTKDYHYVLFGRQTDDQHPECSGVYFEFDGQINGSVDCVTRIVVATWIVEFQLQDGRKIVVRRGMGESQWGGFLKGVHDALPKHIVQNV